MIEAKKRSYCAMYMHEYRKNNPEKVKKYNASHAEYYRQWYIKNKERLREKRKIYYQENKEKILEHQYEYRHKNYELFKQQDRERYRKRVKAHPEKRLQYYDKNRERILAYSKERYKRIKAQKAQEANE